MKDLRAVDSPVRVGLVRYALVLATFHVTTSLLVASVYLSVLGANVLGLLAEMRVLDFLARAELLCILGGASAANTRFLALTRSGLPVTNKLLAECMLRSLTEQAVVVLSCSAAWLASLHFISPVWWHATLASLGGFVISRSVLGAALAFEPSMPLTHGNVLSMSQARRHL